MRKNWTAEIVNDNGKIIRTITFTGTDQDAIAKRDAIRGRFIQGSTKSVRLTER